MRTGVRALVADVVRFEVWTNACSDNSLRDLGSDTKRLWQNLPPHERIHAVSLHAEPRATKDLDVLISTDRDNAQAVYAALAAFGAPLQDISPQDFTELGNFFRMGTPPVMVDMKSTIRLSRAAIAPDRRAGIDCARRSSGQPVRGVDSGKR